MTLVFKPYHQSRFVDWPQDVEEVRASDLEALLALPKFKAISERPDFFRFSRSVGTFKGHHTLMAELVNGYDWHALGLIPHSCGNDVKEMPAWKVKIQ